MNRLWVRLTGAFLLVALVAVLVVAVVIGRVVERSFMGYVGRTNALTMAAELAGQLEAYYAEHGSWEGAADLLPERHGQGGDGQGERRGAGSPGGAQFLLVGGDHVVIAATDPAREGQHLAAGELASGLELYRDGKPVGWLLVETPGQGRLNAAQAQFLDEVQNSLFVLALLAGGLALVMGISISWLLSRPLQQLTEAAQAVAEGELGREVASPSGVAAEITTLTESFNRMSNALAEGELLRQHMTADIAHELRTPLSVMRVQLQAMLDGVTPMDAEHMAVVFEQSLHLTRLVDDLRTLTQAEAGHLPLQNQELAPADLVAKAVTLFEPLALDAGLSLSGTGARDLPHISGDPDRLQQVLANLLANALRHTQSGGRIKLSTEPGEKGVRFTVANSGATLTPEQADRVFDRFWRADNSRTRDRGGAGLGLAISREIVHLHGGRIWVEIDSHETRFIFEIPPV